MKRVAIIGAAGYVGLELARQLQDADIEVNAVARENGKILLQDSGFNVVAPEEIASLGTVDVVVNLAYPTSGPPQHYPTRNQEILGQIKCVMGTRSQLIHVSTQAVFGYGFERAVATAPVEKVHDYAYVEAKIELENLIISEFVSNSVQIVRFGNVWGPGSPTWTAALANKILFGEAVGIEGVDGFCNATDVANAASYLAFLIHRESTSGVHFHHLAELSAYRWSSWIARIEEALGQESVRVPHVPQGLDNWRQEVRAVVSPVMPAALYRALSASKITGSAMRSLIRRLGDQQFDRVKKRVTKTLPSGYSLGAGEATFLNLMSCETQFKTDVLDGWEPPVDFEQSWSRIESWMASAGYTVNRREPC